MIFRLSQIGLKSTLALALAIGVTSAAFVASPATASTNQHHTTNPGTQPTDDQLTPCEIGCAKTLEAALQAAEDARDAALAAADAAHQAAVQAADDDREEGLDNCITINSGVTIGCIMQVNAEHEAAIERADETLRQAIGQANRDFQRDYSAAADAYDACIEDCNDDGGKLPQEK